MNIHLLLQRLGYTPNATLSQTVTHQQVFAETMAEFGTIDIASPIYSPITLANKVYKTLKQEGTDINFYRLGYQLGEKQENPSFNEIVMMLSPWLNDFLRTKKLKLTDQSAISDDLKHALRTEINQAMNGILKGYSLASIYPFLNEVKSIVIKNRDFFEYYRPRDYETYLHDVVKMHALNLLGLDEKITLTDWVANNRLVENLQRSFQRLHAHDSTKALEDMLKQIDKKKKGGIFYRNETDELFAEGFQIATKGLNPSIGDLLSTKYFPVFEHFALRFNQPFSWGIDPAAKAQAVINAVAAGYAEAFYEIFLKEELKTLSEKSPPPVPVAPNAKQPVKLKWNGQMEDLFDVIKQLKEQKALLNSHEELAVFLKHNVDIFEKVPLAEILKAMGQ